MSDQSIGDRVRALVAKELGVDLEKVVDGAHLMKDLGADSLDDVSVIVECEHEFRVEISDDEMNTIETVGDLVKMVEGKVKP